MSAILVVGALLLGAVIRGSGPDVLDPSTFSGTMAQQLSDQLGVHVNVHCPADIPAQTGYIFDCTAIGPSGASYDVRVTEDDARGHVHFVLTGQEVGGPTSTTDPSSAPQEAATVQTGCAALAQLGSEVSSAAVDNMAPIREAMDASPGSPWSQVTRMESLTQPGYKSLAEGTRYLIGSFSTALAESNPTPAQLAVSDLSDSCNTPN